MARTDMDQVARELAAHPQVLRDALDPVDGSEVDTALCSVDTFCGVAIGVMKKTNPFKIRSVAMTFEIKARMDGVPVVRGVS